VRRRRAQPNSLDEDRALAEKNVQAPDSSGSSGRRKKSRKPTNAKEAALSMLARRSYARRGLLDRLRERFPEQESEAAVARLAELGLLDDRDYAERFVRDRFGRAGYGPHRIRRDLMRKGVGGDDADAALAAMIDASDEREKAIAALERFRKRRSVSAEGDATHDPAQLRGDRRAAAHAEFRHLVGKGFSASLVRDLLDVSL
jgi:regulatory protein